MRWQVDGRLVLLTTVLLGLVLAPIGVEAATDNVVIKDRDSQNKANVKNGALAITGSVTVTKDPNNEAVIPGVSPRYTREHGEMGQNTITLTDALAGDQQLRITSLSIANSSDTNDADVVIEAIDPTNENDCTDGGPLVSRIARVMLSPNETLQLTYPHPVVINEDEGPNFCVNARRGDTETATSDPVFIDLHGYMHVF